MEINTVYSNAKYTGLFSNRRLGRLLAQLEEQFEVNAVECASVLNDYTIDMRVAFNDPEKVKAEVSEVVGIDDEGYSWVRFTNLSGLPEAVRANTEGEGWIIAFKREPHPFSTPAFIAALQKELLAEIEATAIKGE